MCSVFFLSVIRKTVIAPAPPSKYYFLTIYLKLFEDSKVPISNNILSWTLDPRLNVHNILSLKSRFLKELKIIKHVM